MRYTAKKIATMLLTMVIVSFLTFVAFSLLSGDAATRLLGTEATPERLEALRIELGLNDPLLVRYGRWLWDALRGDLGTSYRYGQSVSSLIAQRLGRRSRSRSSWRSPFRSACCRPNTPAAGSTAR